VSPARVVLCADDYGLAPGIGQAIRDLVARGRLSAVSCMTVGPFWTEEAARLRDAGDVDVGLHLTLTDQPPLGTLPGTAPGGRLPRFGEMLRRAYRGRLRRDELRDELRRQYDAFVAGWGRDPDFLDGHHHVQQLPVVRDLVADLFEERLRGRRAYVRTCAESVTTVLRRRVFVPYHLAFAWPGGGLRAVLRRRGIPTNDGYSGAYDFGDGAVYASLFDRFLVAARDGMIVNCHPGLVDAALRERDGLTDGREREYAFLSGEEMPEILARRGVVLDRLRPRPRPAAPPGRA
jgi:chitin disaccharide deacetylase